jgi:hypothetical protein
MSQSTGKKQRNSANNNAAANNNNAAANNAPANNQLQIKIVEKNPNLGIYESVKDALIDIKMTAKLTHADFAQLQYSGVDLKQVLEIYKSQERGMEQLSLILACLGSGVFSEKKSKKYNISEDVKIAWQTCSAKGIKSSQILNLLGSKVVSTLLSSADFKSRLAEGLMEINTLPDHLRIFGITGLVMGTSFEKEYKMFVEQTFLRVTGGGSAAKGNNWDYYWNIARDTNHPLWIAPDGSVGRRPPEAFNKPQTGIAEFRSYDEMSDDPADI